MTGTITLRVQLPGLGSVESDVREQLQSATDKVIMRVRAHHFRDPVPLIETTLADELRRVAGGTVLENDLPLAAAAIQRGDYLTAVLVDVHP